MCIQAERECWLESRLFGEQNQRVAARNAKCVRLSLCAAVPAAILTTPIIGNFQHSSLIWHVRLLTARRRRRAGFYFQHDVRRLWERNKAGDTQSPKVNGKCCTWNIISCEKEPAGERCSSGSSRAAHTELCAKSLFFSLSARVYEISPFVWVGNLHFIAVCRLLLVFYFI